MTRRNLWAFEGDQFITDRFGADQGVRPARPFIPGPAHFQYLLPDFGRPRSGGMARRGRSVAQAVLDVVGVVSVELPVQPRPRTVEPAADVSFCQVLVVIQLHRFLSAGLFRIHLYLLVASGRMVQL